MSRKDTQTMSRKDTQTNMLEAAANEVEATGAVTMEDGSVVTFGAKAKMKKTADVDTGECKFWLKNGSIVPFSIPGFDPAASIQIRTLACHGALQMIGDSAVSGEKEKTGVFLLVDQPSLLSKGWMFAESLF